MYAYFQGSHWHFILEYIRLWQIMITQTINGKLQKSMEEALDGVYLMEQSRSSLP